MGAGTPGDLFIMSCVGITCWHVTDVALGRPSRAGPRSGGDRGPGGYTAVELGPPRVSPSVWFRAAEVKRSKQRTCHTY